jgi:hypothetical protein
MLHEFLTEQREELIERCQAKVAPRRSPKRTDAKADHGVPLFLDQLIETLRLELLSSSQIKRSAATHGHELLSRGFTVDQVIHDYGDVCQAVTELAVELNAPITTNEFRILNRCLDDPLPTPSPNTVASTTCTSRTSTPSASGCSPTNCATS